MAPKTIDTAERVKREREGAAVRQHRVDGGWDLGDFATELGISYSYLSNIEAGRKRLTPQLLDRICTLLDVKKMAIRHPLEDAA